MIRFFYVFSCLVCFFAHNLLCQGHCKRVSLSVESDTVLIVKFDLPQKGLTDSFWVDLKFQIGKDLVVPEHVEGDVRRWIQGGQGKSIKWYFLRDIPFISDTVFAVLDDSLKESNKVDYILTKTRLNVFNQYAYIGSVIGGAFYNGELMATRRIFKGLGYNFQLCFGYQFHPNFSIIVHGSLLELSGADSLKKNISERERNLSFRNRVKEFGITFRYNLLSNSRRYELRPQIIPYVYGGYQAYIHRPQALLGGEWIDLQPLGTEGQFLGQDTLLSDYPNPYILTNLAIPIGVGVDYRLGARFSLGVSIGYRFTFTDYLDDVSTSYPNLDDLRAQNPTAFLLSDRSDKTIGGGGTYYIDKVNGVRGNPDNNDGYFSFGITAKYILSKRSFDIDGN